MKILISIMLLVSLGACSHRHHVSEIDYPVQSIGRIGYTELPAPEPGYHWKNINTSGCLVYGCNPLTCEIEKPEWVQVKDNYKYSYYNSPFSATSSFLIDSATSNFIIDATLVDSLMWDSFKSFRLNENTKVNPTETLTIYSSGNIGGITTEPNSPIKFYGDFGFIDSEIIELEVVDSNMIDWEIIERLTYIGL